MRREQYRRLSTTAHVRSLWWPQTAFFFRAALPITLVLAAFLLSGASCLSAEAIARAKTSSSTTSRKTAEVVPPEVGLINAAIEQGWKANSLVPSKAATDGEWCRRIYLDMLGRIPTVEELEAYDADRKRDKRARLVNRLLGDEYAEEFARNWTTVWTNLLIGRTGGTERRSLIDRSGMQEYLREAFRYNKPYDQMARDLITAAGSCRPGAGSVITALSGTELMAVPAETSRGSR